MALEGKGEGLVEGSKEGRRQKEVKEGRKGGGATSHGGGDEVEEGRLGQKMGSRGRWGSGGVVVRAGRGSNAA